MLVLADASTSSSRHHLIVVSVGRSLVLDQRKRNARCGVARCSLPNFQSSFFRYYTLIFQLRIYAIANQILLVWRLRCCHHGIFQVFFTVFSSKLRRRLISFCVKKASFFGVPRGVPRFGQLTFFAVMRARCQRIIIILVLVVCVCVLAWLAWWLFVPTSFLVVFSCLLWMGG